MLQAALDEFANLIPGLSGHGHIHQNQVRIEIAQPHQHGSAVGYGDDLVTLFPQNQLAHALRMRTIVGEQNPAHCVGGGVFFFFFFFLPVVWAVASPVLAAAPAAGLSGVVAAGVVAAGVPAAGVVAAPAAAGGLARASGLLSRAVELPAV